MRVDKPGTKGVLQFNFSGDARKGVQPVYKEVELTREWKRYEFTAVAPQGSVYVAVGPDMSADPASTVTFWADAIQLEKGKTATGFTPREPVELGFDTGKYGNVFASGHPASINVSASNSSNTPKSLTVTIALTDYWDHPFLKRTLPLAIPAHADASKTVPLDLPPGFYRTHCSWTSGGRDHSRLMRLAIIKPYPFDNSPFGLNHGPAMIEACHQFRQAGITWIRNWAVNWEWAEPVPGQLSFKAIDPYIEHLHQEGMHVLGLLPSNPSTNWASEAPGSVPAKLWYRLAYAPKNPDLLYKFVSKAAAHYKGSVSYWEFLNEPLWVPDFCLPKKGGYTITTYLNLLKGASAAIRKANPAAKVIGGLAIQSELPLGDEFIKAGGLDYVDILNLHPYPGTRTPESFVPDMERIRKLMDEHVGRKPIWATETGYYGLDEFPLRPWKPPVDNFAANRLLASEQQCGDYMVRLSTILLANGVEKIFWHEPETGDANDGLEDIVNSFIAPSGLPRKSYVAMAALANVLGKAPSFVCKWQVPAEAAGRRTDNLYGYAFACGDHSTLIAWAASQKGKEGGWTLMLPRHARAQNITGAPLSGGRIMLSGSPVFITSTTLSPSELTRLCTLASP